MLLLATEAGELVGYDPQADTARVLFKAGLKDAFMGIALEGNYLYLASLERIYKLDSKTWQPIAETASYRPSPDFHQMQFYDGLLYTTVTKRNEIWVYDVNLNREASYVIPPPYPDKPVAYKKNYNHINNIVRHAGKYYVNHNWLSATPYAASGVGVFDEQFNLLDKFEFGWETHDFQFVGSDKVALCASSSKRKKIRHPYRAGLMINGELVYEHDPDESFCKGLAYDEEYFYLCGGEKKTRLLRRFANGIIYVVRRSDFTLAQKLKPAGVKAIKGCLLAPGL